MVHFGGQGRVRMTFVFEGLRTAPTVGVGTPGVGGRGGARRAGMMAVFEGADGVGQ